MSEDLVFLRIDGDENLQPNIIAANVVTLLGAIMTIILRFLSRRVSKTKLGLDDWLVIPALICALGYFGNLCGSLSYGFGKYIGAVSFARLRQSFLGIFIGELFYAYSLAFTKFSIIALYSRVFDQNWARTYCWASALINGAWMLACTILACLQCQPTHAFWDRNTPSSKCGLDVRATFLGLGVVTIITDVLLVALPIYICSRLSLSNAKKIMLYGVFVTGLFVTVASGVRLKAILDLDFGISLKSLNITWAFSDTALWSGVEANMAIVSSCLPVLRPLVAKAVPAALVPTSLRKPSQPTSYYGVGHSSRKPSQPTEARMESRTEQSPAFLVPDLEARGVLAPYQEVREERDELQIEEAIPHELRTDRPTRPPTPPPKDSMPVMKAALTRPPSWNMDVAFAEANTIRLEKGSSDSLRETAQRTD